MQVRSFMLRLKITSPQLLSAVKSGTIKPNAHIADEDEEDDSSGTTMESLSMATRANQMNKLSIDIPTPSLDILDSQTTHFQPTVRKRCVL